MSIKSNIFANYVSQLYVVCIGILILPLYIKYMGAEAYGLIGFFTMLQACFVLLDMGLTPTISRETARYFGGSLSSLAYRQLYRALSVIFICIALGGGGALFFLAEEITHHWLVIRTLHLTEVFISVKIMAVSVALRWLCGLYRGVIIGAERLAWLSGFNVIIATLRFVAVFGTMALYGFSPSVFFLHQLVVAIIELVGLYGHSQRLLPSTKFLTQHIGWSIKPIKAVLKFSLSIAFTSVIWVMVTQTDKIILSGILSLAQYGNFTLAVLIASGIMIVSGPVSNAIMPRMANLHAQGKRSEMIYIYRSATQIVNVLAGSVSLLVAFYPKELLFIWTGDRILSETVAPILRLYALGNALLAVGAFPYYLQYALGNLRYHLIGNIIMIVVLLPTIIWAANNYGGVGAGYAWFAINLLYFIFWVGYVHSQLTPGLHIKWLLKDTLAIYIPIFLVLTSSIVVDISISNDSRIILLFMLIMLLLICILTAMLGSEKIRNKIRVKIFRVLR